MLYTYHNKPISITADPKWLDWVQQYLADSLEQHGGIIKRRERDLKAYKLATIAFALRYGLMEQWEKKQLKPSPWPAWVDFEVGDHKIRVVAVSGDVQGNKTQLPQFGYRVNGRVWKREYESGNHTLYVLAVWWAPFVDLIGWLTREELTNFPAPWGYGLQEPAVHPMETIPIAALRK
jgi:hypothetical protein